MKKFPPGIIVACILSVIFIMLSIFIKYGSFRTTNSELSVGSDQVIPDTYVDNVDNSTATPATTDNSNQNQTDLTSKNLFTQYISLQQSGNLNSETSQTLVNDISSQIKITPEKQFALADLNVVQNPTTVDLKNYANKFWVIRNKYKNLYIQNISANEDTSVVSANSGAVQGLFRAGDLYIQMAVELVSIPVPKELANIHLKLINNYEVSGTSLKRLDKIDADPIVTVTGLNTYSKYSDYEDTMLRILANYFSASGIIFSSVDPGIGWKTL